MREPAVTSSDGGFSAHGGTMRVTLNGGATLVWGQPHFIQPSASLLFGSAAADSAAELVNPIDLNGSARRISVFDNPRSDADVAVRYGDER